MVWVHAELQCRQSGIEPALSDQFRVRAGGDSTTFHQDDDPIGLAHRSEPMGNDQRGAVLHQVFQRRLHQTLAFGIQRAGGFIEEQYRRVLEDA
jgi:hypothetical protein